MLIALLFFGCAQPAAPKDSDSAPVQGPQVDYSVAGPYTPGTLKSTLSSSTGLTLTVQVWYPSEDTGGTPITYDGFYDGAAYEDLTPACASVRPVVAFSHGWGSIRWQSSFLMEHLASHGYVVVAPDHLYNTFLDLDSDLAYDVAIRRPQDMADSFDWLTTESTLAGCVDPAAGYAVVGHSFGGYTAFVTAGATVVDPYTSETLSLGDAAVWASVPLAPWDAGGLLSDGVSAITVPVMTLSGTLDETTVWRSVQSLHNGVTSTPRILGEFPNAGHYSFSPMACDLGTTGDGCGDGFIDATTMNPLVNASVLSFLEEVRGSADGLAQLPAESAELIWEIVE